MKTAWVTVGRYGDLCNTLSLVLHDYQQGNQPTVVVGDEWSGLMDGVGYADCLKWHGSYAKPLLAKTWAESLKRFDEIYVPQCYGQMFDRQCSNFCEEAYRLVGLRHLWGQLPLVFDRRNRARENALGLKYTPDYTKSTVLVATKGISHPFPYRDELWQALQPLSATHELIDLSEIKANRFYDLLGFMERAQYLVTVDTGILHLARALPLLPVITLIPGNGQSWDVAPRFKEHIARIYFDEFQSRKGEIVSLIKSGAKPERRLIHVWSEYPRNDLGAQKRHRMAKLTWEREMKGWIDLPLHDSVFNRNARTDFNDHKSAPYVTDMIDRAMATANPGDVVVLTNDDTCVTPNLTRIVKDVLAVCGACWGARREHRLVNHVMTASELMTGRKHVGADIFCFTKEWWTAYGQHMPDMLMAFENWDYVLRTVIDDHGGREVEGLCYHEIHTGDWTKKREIPAAKHNQRMGGEFFEARK